MLRFVLVEILPAAVFLLPLYLVQFLRFRDLRKSCLYFLCSFYLCAVYAFVGLPNVAYIRFDLSGNLIPLAGMVYGLKSSIQNVLLFVPLGIFLPLLGRRYRRVKHTLLFGFCMSLFIELLQIFTYRATDINDLITNTAGTMLGYIFAQLLLKTVPAARQLSRDKSNLLLIFGAAFLIMFFLQPVWLALI